MNAINHIFCEDGIQKVKQHLDECPTCRAGVLSIIDELPPFFAVLIPAEVKAYLKTIKGGSHARVPAGKN